MNPSEIITKRVAFFENKEFDKIYFLYAENSMLRNMYQSVDEYSEFMKDFKKQIEIEKIQFLNEVVKNRLAKIEYFEYIFVNGKKIVQYCTTYLKLINDEWKITKEDREIIRGQEE